MNDSIEPRNRKYVEGHGFLLFVKSAAIRFGNKYAKKMMDTAPKAGMDDLIENKIVGKIASAGKSKKGTTETQQNDEVNETQKIYMPPEKCQ